MATQLLNGLDLLRWVEAKAARLYRAQHDCDCAVVHVDAYPHGEVCVHCDNCGVDGRGDGQFFDWYYRGGKLVVTPQN